MKAEDFSDLNYDEDYRAGGDEADALIASGDVFAIYEKMLTLVDLGDTGAKSAGVLHRFAEFIGRTLQLNDSANGI